MEDRPPRDVGLLDALDRLPGSAFSGRAWRVVRVGRDPIQSSAVGGRWDDRTFEVLYTSLAKEGAVAEMYYHVSRGQPVIPSKVTYELHELEVVLENCLELKTFEELEAIGLSTGSYGQLSYAERQTEYPRSQQIAEAAFFLGRDGIIVPNARFACLNLILFAERVPPDSLNHVQNHGPVDWRSWTGPKGT